MKFRYTPIPMMRLIQKESVGSFVYPLRGSDKTQHKINNTPHLYSIEYIIISHTDTSDECYCLPLCYWKLSDFEARLNAKHFHQICRVLTDMTKIENVFQKYSLDGVLLGQISAKKSFYATDRPIDVQINYLFIGTLSPYCNEQRPNRAQ